MSPTILAIESSGSIASVALLADDRIKAEYSIDYKKTHSQTILPMIDEIVKMTEINLHDIDAIAISSGPGSFTGLRIGASTAKGLGLSLNKPLISVPTLDAMAMAVPYTDAYIYSMMDARCDRVFVGTYQYKDKLIMIEDARDENIDILIDKINDSKKEAILLGDGACKYKDRFNSDIKVAMHILPLGINRQRAALVATLGARLYEEGHMINADDFVPIYIKDSSAKKMDR